MPVQTDGLTSTKDRPLPVQPDGQVPTQGAAEIDLLGAILREMQAVRLILAEAFDIDIDPEEME